MIKTRFQIMLNTMIFSTMVLMSTVGFTAEDIKITGELKAMETDNFSPPRIEGVWQYTISFMAEDGSVVKPGMPILMFKTDDINRKLIEAKGKLGIKQSEVKNNKANELESFEKKSIAIEEKKMQLEKAQRKAELPKSVLAQNDFQENQLRLQLAQKQYDSSKLDYELSIQKSRTDQKILQTEINKLNGEIDKFTASIASMNMFAKAEGIVMHKSNWQGDKYAVGDTTWGNKRIIEVANLSKIIAKVEIAENNIKHIELNQRVKVKLDALPDKEFNGVIVSIAKVVRIKSRNQPSKILEAVVEINNVDTELMRPGMRLSATISNDNTESSSGGNLE